MFSRGETDSEDAEMEDAEMEGKEDAERAVAASRAFARLFRCMRVIESATFGSSSCADAVVTGDL